MGGPGTGCAISALSEWGAPAHGVTSPSVRPASAEGHIGRRSAVAGQWERQKRSFIFDEVLVVTAGAFTLRLANRAIEAKPGDVLWILKGTAVTYEGRVAQAVYVYIGDALTACGSSCPLPAMPPATAVQPFGDG